MNPLAAPLLLQQLGPVSADGMAMARDIAIVAAALALMIFVWLATRTLREYRKTLHELRKRVLERMSPVSDRATTIADNLEFITQAVRSDVVLLSASFKQLDGRLNQASDRLEERIEEFNALMEVVQSEAEGIFLDTAATVRGVRAGAKAMATPDRRGRLADPEKVTIRALEASAGLEHDQVGARAEAARRAAPAPGAAGPDGRDGSPEGPGRPAGPPPDRGTP